MIRGDRVARGRTGDELLPNQRLQLALRREHRQERRDEVVVGVGATGVVQPVLVALLGLFLEGERGSKHVDFRSISI